MKNRLVTIALTVAATYGWMKPDSQGPRELAWRDAARRSSGATGPERYSGRRFGRM